MFTSKYPIPNHLPDLAKWFPNVYFTYTEPSKDLLKTALTHEYDITINARFFENGKEWRVPKENYAWNERFRMSDLGVYKSTHRGDTMLAVTDKRTDTIIVAYNTEIFEYKN